MRSSKRDSRKDSWRPRAEARPRRRPGVHPLLDLSTELVWFNLDGVQGDSLPLAAGQYNEVRFSPDGTRVATARFERDNPLASGSDIWLVDLARKSASRVTFDPQFEFAPVWSPDGKDLLQREQDRRVPDLSARPRALARRSPSRSRGDSRSSRMTSPPTVVSSSSGPKSRRRASTCGFSTREEGSRRFPTSIRPSTTPTHACPPTAAGSPISRTRTAATKSMSSRSRRSGARCRSRTAGPTLRGRRGRAGLSSPRTDHSWARMTPGRSFGRGPGQAFPSREGEAFFDVAPTESTSSRPWPPATPPDAPSA